MINQSVLHEIKSHVVKMTILLKRVRPDKCDISSHWAPSISVGRVCQYSLVVDCHCRVYEYFDNIRKFYKASYINIQFLQGLLSVKSL